MQQRDREFYARAASVPVHGIGLSVDVYSPDLVELCGALDVAGCTPEYLEIFKAPSTELTRIRRGLPQTTMAYHAEGVWLIDPEMRTRYPWMEQTRRMSQHALILKSAWVNHECASKQFAGYSFGTYLPPLFTVAAAEATGANAVACQQVLQQCTSIPMSDTSPLLLLELPPLTYVAFGDLSPAAFFSYIAEAAPCGFVLDIGHLWTVWRYLEQGRFDGIESFTDAFLDEFPLHRVIQIHLAGLGSAETDQGGSRSRWVDAHSARVPSVLWDLLRRVLDHPGLSCLKGIALEVDTKSIPLIVEEFGRLQQDFKLRARVECADPKLEMRSLRTTLTAPDEQVCALYGAYARVLTGQESVQESALEPLSWQLDRDGLAQYIGEYLPHELLHWGGDLDELFPTICRALKDRGISHDDFVEFWFRDTCSAHEAYDFFYIKLDRWVEFIRERAPDLCEEAARDAHALRKVHEELNDEPAELIDRSR